MVRGAACRSWRRRGLEAISKNWLKLMGESGRWPRTSVARADFACVRVVWSQSSCGSSSRMGPRPHRRTPRYLRSRTRFRPPQPLRRPPHQRLRSHHHPPLRAAHRHCPRRSKLQTHDRPQITTHSHFTNRTRRHRHRRIHHRITRQFRHYTRHLVYLYVHLYTFTYIYTHSHTLLYAHALTLTRKLTLTHTYSFTRTHSLFYIHLHVLIYFFGVGEASPYVRHAPPTPAVPPYPLYGGRPRNAPVPLRAKMPCYVAISHLSHSFSRLLP
mgnify:CR=1 FL=1